MAKRNITGVRNNSDGTTTAITYAIGNDNSGQISASDTLTTSNTSLTLDWGPMEGTLMCSGTFGSGGTVTLSQKVGSVYVDLADGALTAAGGFKFVSGSDSIKATLSGGDGTTAIYVQLNAL